MTVLNDRIVEEALLGVTTMPFRPAGQSTEVVESAA